MKIGRYLLAGIVFFFLLSGNIGYTQNVSTGSGRTSVAPKGNYLKLKLVDSLTANPIEFATVALIPAGQTNVSKYTMTDVSGTALLQGLRTGKYTMQIDYTGYKAKRLPIEIKAGANNLGSVPIQEEVNMLDEVVITGVANPVVIKKDTIEYNSAAFQVNETDALEELLKKLPGVEIDENGKITANGKEINQIMIDGKKFFLNDPQVATKNLPAKIIDKVRVVERKSDQARFTGIDDGEEETVIDLSVKKGMMNGWFGNLMGGYGTKDRYQANGMIGRFTKTDQFIFMGGANNTNNRGFAEMAGGGGGGFGFSGRGITTSRQGGAMANTEFLDGKLKMQSNYRYFGSDKDVEERRARQTFRSQGEEDGEAKNILYYDENGADRTVNDGHQIGLELEYELSKNTSFLFRPSFRLNNSSSDSFNEYTTRNNDDLTNIGSSKSVSDTDSKSTDGMFLWRQRLGKPGRTISLMFNYSYSDSETNGNNYSQTDYYVNNVVDSVGLVDQNYLKEDDSYSLAGRLSYTEPLGRKFYLEAAYRYSYQKSISNKWTYDKDNGGDYNILVPEYSNFYENIYVNQRAELNLRKQETKYNFTIGGSLQPSYTKSLGTIGESRRDYKNSVLNFSPSARFDYRFADNKFLRFTYRGSTSQPSVNQLQPIQDNSNPLRVTIGNPDLKPSFSQNMRLEYRANNRETFSNLNASLNFTYTSNQIVSSSNYREDGVQEIGYENADGSYSANGRFMYNGRFGKSNFSYVTNTSVRFSNGISFNDHVKNITKTLTASEWLQLTFRNNYMEIRAGGRVNYQNAWYSVQGKSKTATWTNAITGSVNVNIPGGFNITTDIARTFYIGFDAGYGQNSTLWNAELSKNLFKNAATLKVKIYDILKDEKSTYRTTTDNYIQDVENNTLGQYVMFSLVYRFGTFGGGGMRRGPGGPRPGGFGPRR